MKKPTNRPAMVSIEPLAVDKETAGQMLAAISESTIDDLLATDPTFPRPRQISGRRVGFPVAELKEWFAQRPVSKLLPPANTGAKKPRPSGQETQGIQKAA